MPSIPGTVPTPRPARVVAAAVALACVASLVGSFVAADPMAARGEDGPSGTVGIESPINDSDVGGSRAFDGADHVTVVATQGFYVSDEEAELIAFDGDGEVLSHNDTYRVYFDVDPVPGERYTVEYVAAKHLSGEDCAAVGTDRCTRNVVERMNLSTDESERVHAEVTERLYSARWHDVDRINGTHLAVAGIVHDRVFVVDQRSRVVTWQWNASEHYPPDAGGNDGDWTHVNDVEPLDDGRIMVSLRNMDEVVFLRPGEGVQDGWTLGEDENYDILHEAHNPDYLPAERGGPAILVADSENNRVVEYARENGSWRQAWTWRDARLQWPRDADRLPSGRTLVVDSHGDRVLEIVPNGSAVWNVTIGMPYDAERLGTGGESTGGQAITTTGVGGSAGADRSLASRAVLALKSAVPNIVVNSLLYVSPSWVRFTDLLVAAILLLDLLVWGGLELRWSSVGPGSFRGAVVGFARR